MGKRVSTAAGIKPGEFEAMPLSGSTAGQGGPFVPFEAGAGHAIEGLSGVVSLLAIEADQCTDVFTLRESRLLESRLRMSMVPTVRSSSNRPGRDSVFAPIRFLAAPHCTPSSTSRRRPKQRCVRRPLGSFCVVPITRTTTTLWNSITAMASPRATHTVRACSSTRRLKQAWARDGRSRLDRPLDRRSSALRGADRPRVPGPRKVPGGCRIGAGSRCSQDASHPPTTVCNGREC